MMVSEKFSRERLVIEDRRQIPILIFLENQVNSFHGSPSTIEMENLACAATAVSSKKYELAEGELIFVQSVNHEVANVAKVGSKPLKPL